MDEYTITVDGDPPKKNERDRVRVVKVRGKYVPRRYTTKEFEQFCLRVCEAAGGRGRMERSNFVRIADPPIRIDEGQWTISIVAYWRRKSNKYGGGVGDWDAPAPCVGDALERAGVLDNDARIKLGTASTCHDPARPRLVITLERIR